MQMCASTSFSSRLDKAKIYNMYTSAAQFKCPKHYLQFEYSEWVKILLLATWRESHYISKLLLSSSPYGEQWLSIENTANENTK